jgi:hypothetical protein
MENTMKTTITVVAGISLFVAVSPATAKWVWVPNKIECTVNDPTDTPLNVRSAPNGQILGALNNDTIVTLQGRAVLASGQKWVRVVPEVGKSGWVFFDYLSCGD